MAIGQAPQPEDKSINVSPAVDIESKSNWSLEVLDQIKEIKPSKNSTEKGKEWMVTHFMIERPDGTTEEVESTKIILKINGKDGTEVEVPAFTVHHVMDLHLNGKEAGSVLEGGLEASFALVLEHMPREIPFKGQSAAFEINVGRNVGTEGVASQKEMMEKGIATAEDLEILSSAKDEAFRLNVGGTTDEEKKKFVDEFNAKLSGNVKLGIRGGSITPFFSADRPQSSKMFLVIGKEKDPEGAEHNVAYTMAPGRYMEKLPTDRSFSNVAELWKRLKSGEKLTPEEIALIDAQKKAQECWWNGGFIAPPEKKEPTQLAEEKKVEQPNKESFKVVKNSKEEYGDINTLFLIEHLDSNFDMVEKQMENLRNLIIKYNKVNEAHKKDPDMDMYVDEALMDIEDLLKSFKIGDKEMDIRELTGEVSYEDIYNDIIIEINNYIEYSMIGSGEEFLRTI